MSSETVLITGASSGIGLELARLFAADGSQLILVARREEKLQQLAEELKTQHGTESIVIASDLAVPGASQQLFDDIQERGIEVDVLVNNAGFGQYGPFDETPLSRYQAMIDLNVKTLTELAHLYLTDMKTRGRGAILNLGSTASFQPGPNSAVYYATKAFVLSFSEALWEEARHFGVHVCVLCPGPTKTEFGEDSDMGDSFLFKYNAMRVEDVAQAGFRGVRRRKRLVMPGIINNLLAWSVRFSHRRAIIRVMSWLQPRHIGKK